MGTLPPALPGARASLPPFVKEARPEIASLPPAPLTPRNAADLKAIQDRVEAVVKMALPATVGLQVSDGQGSGVIVSKDGYVLTAGHVSGKPHDPVFIILSNGVRVRGESLGANNGIDSGMVKITTPGDYPFVPFGTTAKLVSGQWVVALGHPGGYQPSRPPVVRLGRILNMVVGPNNDNLGYIGTDCPLINGDSGGPLFDLDGRLIGINSRIGEATTMNIHVPIDTFARTWDRLAGGDEWNNNSVLAGGRGGGDCPGGLAAADRAIRRTWSRQPRRACCTARASSGNSGTRLFLPRQREWLGNPPNPGWFSRGKFWPGSWRHRDQIRRQADQNGNGPGVPGRPAQARRVGHSRRAAEQ